MKNALYIVNGILLVAVGVLFYLHFSEKKSPVSVVKASTWADTSKSNTRIAYFEWDSIENQKFYKDMQADLNERNEELTRAKIKMSQDYQTKLDSYNKQPMSQVESDQATKEMRSLEENIRTRLGQMEQNLNDYAVRKKVDFNDKIRAFLKEYNKSKGFTYIISNEPGFIFYRDSAYNITSDVVAGLNAIFTKKK